MKGFGGAGRALDFSLADPVAVFLARSLLYPVIPGMVLWACLAWWGMPLQSPYYMLALLAFLGMANRLDVHNLHEGARQRASLRAFLTILFQWLVVLSFMWAILLLAGLQHELNYPVFVSWVAGTPPALWLGQLAIRQALHQHSRLNDKTPRKAVVVGLTDAGARLSHTLRHERLLNIDVLGFFDERSSDRYRNPHNETHLGKPDELPNFITQQGVNQVYITLPMARDQRILDLLDKLKDSTASVYFVPDMFVLDSIQSRMGNIKGIPVMSVCESPFFGMNGVLKRVSDVLIASLILLLIWPVLLLLALAVKLDSPGPALFKQHRYGLDGKEIKVYKFRSMRVMENGAEVRQATADDDRITRVGRVLRKTSLDELPQFINVLQGRMSIVGPRPHAIAHNEQYRKLIKGYMVRHKVKPGITGLAQISGCRGETETVEKMEDRIRFDLDYLRNWSLWLDIKIILKTIPVLWGDRSAY